MLLVQSEAGYRNLLAGEPLLSGQRGAAEPSISLGDIAAASEGLICLAGGPKGPVGRC